MPHDYRGVSEARVIEGADILLRRCGRLGAAERVAIVCDRDTRVLGDILAERAALITNAVHLVEVEPYAMHGQEPSPEASEQMLLADLCLGITAKSMYHTAARKEAAARGTRYLSLPDFSLALMADEALRVDFEARGAIGARVAAAFTRGNQVRVTNPRGTDVTMRIAGRTGNSTPGYVSTPGATGSPPDIETYVAPLETSAHGVIIVDGSIPFPTLGLIKDPLRLTVEGGRVVDIQGDDPRTVAELRKVFAQAGSPKAYVLAECGVGLNDLATLTGVMLTDEGAAGTVHFGFGSNSTIGGLNEISFHLDVVLREPTLAVDGIVIIDRSDLKV